MNATLNGNVLTITIPLGGFNRSKSGKMDLCTYVPWSDLGLTHNGSPIRATVTVGRRAVPVPAKGGKAAKTT